MEELVSIIIPTYNSEKTVRRAVDSALTQDYQNKEILVIDDGSVDNTLQVLSIYDNSIIIIVQQNKGPSAARNTGINNSNGKYIAFLDSDDYWEQGFLTKCINVLTNNTSVVAVNVATKALHWSGKEVINPAFVLNNNLRTNVEIIDDFFSYWAKYDHIRTGSVVINRNGMDEFPLMREDLKLSEDLEYWGILATYGTWAFIPEVLLVTDGWSGNISMNWKKKNEQRRMSCPTVEVWQDRLLTKLKDSDLSGFYKLRGRIARNFTHTKLLVGDNQTARSMVIKYGKDFPSNRFNDLMLLANKYGSLSWWIFSHSIRMREFVKNLLLQIR